MCKCKERREAIMQALREAKVSLLEKWEAGWKPQTPQEYEQLASEAQIRREILDGIR